jgi:UDP-2,3-diacylglucosamine pyrophosphatase LpxH
MPIDDGRDLVIVSDFHMSSGYNPRTGTYDRNEDFFYDAAFSRFIDDLIKRGQVEPRDWRLVILGDFVDFLQVPPPENGDGRATSCQTTVAKLERIARGHREMFAALGRLLDAGHVVDLVLGNHDIEFIWPEVQTRFKELVGEHTQVDVTVNITFHPWFYYVPNLVYAEHGHQYDSVNSFPTLLRPYLPGRPDEIELPLGSFFVLYLFNYIERIDPFADNIKPVTRYLAWALRAHPVIGLSTLGYHVRFFIRVLKKTSGLTQAEQHQRRAQYRDEQVREHAQQVGLSAAVLDELDRLSAVPALSSKLRQLEALILRPLLPSLPVVAALVAMYQAVKRIRPGARSLLTLAGGFGALLWRERRLLRPTTDAGSYLYRAARQVHDSLSRANAAVPAYVFGHTHTAEVAPLAETDESPRYYNCGTWTPLVPQTFELLSTRERFTFVQITRDPSSRQVTSRLLIWNDAANRAEPLPLLMT